MGDEMRSANEISGVVLKAARGVGLPLGCAEDLARAAPWLAHAGELECLPDLLIGPFHTARLEQGRVYGGHPVLALIAWRDLRQAGEAVELVCDSPAPLVRAFEAAGTSPVPAGPFMIKDDLWRALDCLAARTFVPDTDASRRAGAGAEDDGSD